MNSTPWSPLYVKCVIASSEAAQRVLGHALTPPGGVFADRQIRWRAALDLSKKRAPEIWGDSGGIFIQHKLMMIGDNHGSTSHIGIGIAEARCRP